MKLTNRLGLSLFGFYFDKQPKITGLPSDEMRWILSSLNYRVSEVLYE